MTETVADPQLIALHAPVGVNPHKQPSGRFFQPDAQGIVYAFPHEVADLVREGYSPLGEDTPPEPSASKRPKES